MTKVLIVVGTSRCGSSVLGATLGEASGVVNIGELKNLWSIGLAREGFTCACGTVVRDCEFWSEVRREAGLADASVEQMVALEANHVHTAAVARGLGHYVDDNPWSAAIAAIYAAVQRITGAALVIDTSKRPSFAAVVSGHPHVDAVAAHLVRDPRGHVVSRHRGWQGEHGLDHPLERGDAARVVLSWSKTNALAELLAARSRRQRTIRVRYEEFVAGPVETARDLLQLAGHDVDLPHIDGDTVTIGEQHAIAGSLSRGPAGTTRLTNDEAWRRFLSPTAQRALYVTGLPLTAFYRYPVTAR